MAASNSDAGSALNDPQDATGRRQREPVERQAHTNKWAVLGLVAVGTFMTTLDTSIVNISLPSIARTFHTPFGGAVEWVIIAYLLSSTVVAPLYGKLSDIHGRRAMMLTALGLFIAGSAAAAVAPNMAMLIAARTLQGVGGGGITPLVQITIRCPMSCWASQPPMVWA